MKPFEFHYIKYQGDERGDSYSLPQEAIDFVGRVEEIHVATIVPGAIRGNHFHADKKEATVLVFSDGCRLAWKPLNAGEPQQTDFDGKDAIVFKVLPNVIHAIKNTGNRPMILISFSNGRNDPQNPDTFRHTILK
jgi:oxalate decarboxylase/phosphoglucose isomerase-like protein (cupin superfamily)